MIRFVSITSMYITSVHIFSVTIEECEPFLLLYPLKQVLLHWLSSSNKHFYFSPSLIDVSSFQFLSHNSHYRTSECQSVYSLWKHVLQNNWICNHLYHLNTELLVQRTHVFYIHRNGKYLKCNQFFHLYLL